MGWAAPRGSKMVSSFRTNSMVPPPHRPVVVEMGRRWTGEPLLILVGGFEQNPSEKYELVSWDDEIPNIYMYICIYV